MGGYLCDLEEVISSQQPSGSSDEVDAHAPRLTHQLPRSPFPRVAAARAASMSSTPEGQVRVSRPLLSAGLGRGPREPN